MPTYLLAPGAWPGGSGLNPPDLRRGLSAGLNPDPRRGGGTDAWLNPDPRRGGGTDAWLNPDPGGRSNSGHGGPGVPPGAGSPGPWHGIDPDWVYSGGDAALLAQALRRMHAKVVQAGDPIDDPRKAKSPKAKGQILQATAGPMSGKPLWRWGSEFRVRAAVADLVGRFFVEEKKLWLITRSAKKAPTLTCAASFEVKPLDATDATAHDLQIDKVLRAAVEREDRLPEILMQSTDLWPFYGSVTGIDLARAPITAELLDVAWRWADHIVMALKHQVAEPRPVQRDARVLPVIPTPGHGSLPSGHATISKLTSDLLIALLYAPESQRALQLDRLARRIAFNRVVAGVHFPMDSEAGHVLGRQLAALFIALATGTRAPQGSSFVAKRESTLKESDAADPVTLAGKGLRPSLPLNEMWNAAKRELEALRV